MSFFNKIPMKLDIPETGPIGWLAHRRQEPELHYQLKIPIGSPSD